MSREREAALEKLIGDCTVRDQNHGVILVIWPRNTTEGSPESGIVTLRLGAIRHQDGYRYIYTDVDSELFLQGTHEPSVELPGELCGESTYWLDIDPATVAGVVGEILHEVWSKTISQVGPRMESLMSGVPGALSGSDSSTPVAEQ